MNVNILVKKAEKEITQLEKLQAISPKITGVITTTSVKDGIATVEITIIASDALSDTEQAAVKTLLGD
jgi:hypothetical protein